MSDQRPDIILGLQMPDVDRWSERVVVALGQNPSAFTGPGTNTYLVGTGARRILLDTGGGVPEYLPVLERAIEEAGCEGLEQIVLTHGHPDHTGGIEQVLERFGELEIKKHAWPGFDAELGLRFSEIADGDVVRTEGATLRAIHTPGHCPDHVCFVLEEDRALFTGDNVLGVGTTVIPSETGDLGAYMSSLDRILEERPERIYPAHGPMIQDGSAKIEEYIAHRRTRDDQILAALGTLDDETGSVIEIVKIVYAAYPEALHAAAGQSVTSHLIKLERDGHVRRATDDSPLSARWQRQA